MGSVKKLIALVYLICFFCLGFLMLQPFKNPSDVFASEAATAENMLSISALNLEAPVKNIGLTGKELISPEQIAGAYSNAENKTLIIGHSSTIFKDLHNIKLDDEIKYNDQIYSIYTIKNIEKSKVDMAKILQQSEQKTIVIMTCSGQKISGQDYTHRLIITAKLKD